MFYFYKRILPSMPVYVGVLKFSELTNTPWNLFIHPTINKMTPLLAKNFLFERYEVIM